MMVEPGSGGTAGSDGDFRASSADREHAVEALKAAFAEGCLTLEEHLERAERAYNSRTRAELAALSADLPAGPLATPPSQPAGPPAASGSRQTNPLAVASVVCGLIPLLPATLAAIILGITARRQIQRTHERGRALATTGLAMGALWIALTITVLFVL